MRNQTEEQELRFHMLLCHEATEALDKVKHGMRYIEFDRARRYGRTESVAVKAYDATGEVSKALAKVTEIWNSLQTQEKTGRKPRA